MNLRFPGQVFDGETGLHYNYFRDYDPSTGRYVESNGNEYGGGGNEYPAAPPIASTNPFGSEPGFAAGANGGGAISSSNAFGAVSAAGGFSGTAAAGGSYSSGVSSAVARALPVLSKLAGPSAAAYTGFEIGWAAGTILHERYGDSWQPTFDWVFDHTIGDPMQAGKEQGRNYITQQARIDGKALGMDPCDYYK